MSTMIKKRVAELECAQLDWAVTVLCEEYKRAHAHFPTMTLDSTFCGAFIVDRGSNKECWLKPNNPMRQDACHFSPSTGWCHGGPIIEREGINVVSPSHDFASPGDKVWSADYHGAYSIYFGKTPLIAAMRAFVASKLGDEVEVPA